MGRRFGASRLPSRVVMRENEWENKTDGNSDGNSGVVLLGSTDGRNGIQGRSLPHVVYSRLSSYCRVVSRRGCPEPFESGWRESARPSPVSQTILRFHRNLHHAQF